MWLILFHSFRWISRQLETLHRDRSILHGIRDDPQAAQALLSTLGTGLEEQLDEISEEKSQDAILLFKCLIAAFRPLRLREVAEIIATQSKRDTTCYGMNLPSEYRAFIDERNLKGSKIVQFSSPFVKEFLTSEHLQTSKYGNISRYHITQGVAHTALSRVCIRVLLQLDGDVDKISLRSLPLSLAFYAGSYWVDHIRSGNVSQNLDIMKQLFDPGKSHLEVWVWMYDVENERRRTMEDLESRPSPRSATALYYAASCNFSELVIYLANAYPEDLMDTTKYGYHGAPLHVASYKGYLGVARALLECRADVNEPVDDRTPLQAAYSGKQWGAMKLLLQHRANMNAGDTFNQTLLHRASRDGQSKALAVLLDHQANINARNRNGWTPLHWAVLRGHIEVTKYLLDKGAAVNLQSLNKNTPLYIASITGNLEVVEMLLRSGADASIKGEHDWTPLEAARGNGRDTIAKLLSSGGNRMPLNRDIPTNEVQQMKRRALLVGITYSKTYSDMWPQLYGPHDDVDNYRGLLVSG